MIKASLCLLVGVLAPQLSSFPVSYDGLAAQFVVLVSAAVFFLPGLRRSDLLLLLGGSVLFWLAANDVIASRLDPIYVGDSLLVDVRITEFPIRRADSTSFIAMPVDDARLGGRIRVSWYESPVKLRLGDVWRLELRLRRPRGSSNPGTMDYEAWLLQQGITAIGYVVAGRRNILMNSDTTHGIDRLRLRLVERIERRIPNRETAAIVSAIVVGARHAVSVEQWQRYARTGSSHLMAISGLHIGLAAAASYFLASILLGLLGRHGNYHCRALLFALIVAAAYAAVSGFAVPARRATIMLVLVTAVLLLRRQLSPARILAATAILIVLSDPLATMTAGFKLSFSAVCLLFWHAQRRRCRHDHYLRQSLHGSVGLLQIQLMLFMGLLPLTMLIFGRVSLVAPLLNLLAVPLFSFVTVPLALLGVVFSGILPAFADVVLGIAGLSIEWLERLIAAAARSPASSTLTADLAAYRPLLLVPVLWIVLPGGWPGRELAWIGVVAILTWKPPAPPAGCVDISVLDVGQGQALVLQTSEHTLVYDTGPAFRGGSSAASSVLLPFLARRGIPRIDRLVVSHSDLDHAGGVLDLLNAIPVGDVLSGDALPWIDAPISRCTSDISWRWADVSFSFLHPASDWVGQGNDSSCVLLVEAGAHRALISGDIESRVEAQLVRARILPAVSVVTVPHHGSRTSSSPAFVASLKPSIALVSAGHNNRWGFPKPDIVARWQNQGAQVLNTATSGAISHRMCVNGEVAEVKQHRVRYRRIWHEVDS